MEFRLLVILLSAFYLELMLTMKNITDNQICTIGLNIISLLLGNLLNILLN